MTAKKSTPYQLFIKSLAIKRLNKIFESKIKFKKSKGIDKINAYQFSKNKEQYLKNLKIIKYKCQKKIYKFSPYVEVLKTKGRNKIPRIIAIPTVRDRIVLYIIQRILSIYFDECVRKKLANTYIYDIQKVTNHIDAEKMGVFRTDINNFYGSINRELLIEKISNRIRSKKILELIKQAISTPIVPKNYKKSKINEYHTNKGIPQGLSISNILANIYVSEDIDLYITRNYCCHYFRYVDDIIVFVEKEKLKEIENIVISRLNHLKLEHNDEKTFSDAGNKPFEYLGYRFELPIITVRQSTVNNFINSIAAKFSDYVHNKQKKLNRYNYLNENRLKEIFLSDLNEKITGAISENKRYGWIFYFNAINDLSLLYKIDKIIGKFFARLKDFNYLPPSNLKKLHKAFYHVKDSRKINSGYIHNYNNYTDANKKLIFLNYRGYLDPNKNYHNSEIEKLFERIKAKKLAHLEKDDANIY